MKNLDNRQRHPRSMRKHIRHLKANLRRELPPQEAAKTIERELRRIRRDSAKHSH